MTELLDFRTSSSSYWTRLPECSTLVFSQIFNSLLKLLGCLTSFRDRPYSSVQRSPKKLPDAVWPAAAKRQPRARRGARRAATQGNEEVQQVAKMFLRDNYQFLTVGIVGSAQNDVSQQVLPSLFCSFHFGHYLLT